MNANARTAFDAPFGRLLYALAFLCLCPAIIHSQVIASGQQLTVTTANATAVFQGPDLVGYTNNLTGESCLRIPPPTPMANLDLLNPSGRQLQSSAWTIAVSPGNGANVATLSMQDGVRTVTTSVSVDPLSQEIVLRMSGASTTPGVSDAYWSIDGLDLSAGQLIVPAHNGIAFDQQHQGVGATLEYPSSWNAQMLVYQTKLGSVLLYSTDSQYLFKQLRIGSRGNSTVDLSVVTEALPPWPSAVAVPSVEWRLKAFSGDWKTAAAPYRDWLIAQRPPVAAQPWVQNIRTVVRLSSLDPTLLDTLAGQFTPAKTMLYIPGWRQSDYDVNYPDYTPASGIAALVAKAHTLGFKVMLHTDFLGVSPGNPDYASVQAWQLKDPATLQLQGWLWDNPVSTPNRFAFVNPAASAYRRLLVSRIGAAVAAVQPDALHLDVSGYMWNDGNGPIEGMSYPQGAVQLHKDLLAAFPTLALGGEGMNDVIYGYNSFAQHWWLTVPGNPPGHPITNFLFNSHAGSQIEYYGHLSQPPATDPGFMSFVEQTERRGILPNLGVFGASDLDLTNADNARLIHWLQNWQSSAAAPAWSSNWNGAVLRYQQGSNPTAALFDTGTVATLYAAGSTPLYQRVHDTAQQTTTAYILNWPAFDAGRVYGLNPAAQYWLDSNPRPVSTHLGGLPAGVMMGSDTMVASRFAYFDLAAVPPYDFFNNLWAAKTGVSYLGVDYPLANGAIAQVQDTAAGGVMRQGIAMSPPWLGQVGGEAFVEWPVPVTSAEKFSFSVGVADAASCTDGVTFRVVVNGKEAWRQNLLRVGWVDGTVDLSSYAGSSVPVRIVANPGPANNTGCDWASFTQLALIPSAPLTASVPLVMKPGAAMAVITAGVASVAGSPTVVSNLPVPGHFAVFTSPGSSIAGGTSLTSIPYEVWKGADGQLPVPGAIYGSGAVGAAASGGVTKQNAIFGHPPNEGRTILSWTLAVPAAGDFRLGWSSAMQDGAQSSTGVQFSVRVNGATQWTMPLQTPAAGWQPGSLDLSVWRGQNILLQLVTDSLGANDSDWAWWADLAVVQTAATN